MKYQLSIVIPTWNRTTELFELIKSIGDLSHGLTEVIIVDNHSEIPIKLEIKKFTAHQEHIYFHYNNENMGMVRNWNKALSLANAPWVSFFCSDDLMNENGQVRMLKYIQELAEQKKAPILVLQDPQIETEYVDLKSGLADQIRLPIVSGNLWSKEIQDSLGGFNENLAYSPDGEIWFRWAKSYPVRLIKQNFASYRQHTDNFAFTTYQKNDFLDQQYLMARLNSEHKYSNASLEFQNKLATDNILLTAKTAIMVCAVSKKHKKLISKILSDVLKQNIPFLQKLKFSFWWIFIFPVQLIFKIIRFFMKKIFNNQ